MEVIRRIQWYVRAQARARRFGIPFARRRSLIIPASIRVGGRRISIAYRDEHGVRVDFIGVFLDDTYRIERVFGLDPKVEVIVDVGANVGWFALAARSYFPNALISVYEPNVAIHEALSINMAAIGATRYVAAIGGRREMVSLEVGNETNLGRTVSGGEIPQETLQDVLKRVGGRVDLLKLDCEGAEWSILDSPTDWTAIRWITMEYHLWARPGGDHAAPVVLLKSLGFRVLEQACDRQWGTLLAENQRWRGRYAS